jgi:hypothetical protein
VLRQKQVTTAVILVHLRVFGEEDSSTDALSKVDFENGVLNVFATNFKNHRIPLKIARAQSVSFGVCSSVVKQEMDNVCVCGSWRGPSSRQWSLLVFLRKRIPIKTNWTLPALGHPRNHRQKKCPDIFSQERDQVVNLSHSQARRALSPCPEGSEVRTTLQCRLTVLQRVLTCFYVQGSSDVTFHDEGDNWNFFINKML